MPVPFAKLGYGLAGLLLLPAVAGLAQSAFHLLVEVQMDGNASRGFIRFAAGAGVWLLGFLFLGRPVRTYVLAHELCHLLAAWLGGVRGGRLRVGRHGGSVEVERSTLWIALAPYMIPFYSLALLALHALASLWWNPAAWADLLPFALGLTWSFHITFTLYALLRGQSDLRPYGWLGSLPLILCGNLLLVCAALALISPLSPARAAIDIAVHQRDAYAAALSLLRSLWNSSLRIQ